MPAFITTPLRLLLLASFIILLQACGGGDSGEDPDPVFDPPDVPSNSVSVALRDLEGTSPLWVQLFWVDDDGNEHDRHMPIANGETPFIDLLLDGQIFKVLVGDQPFDLSQRCEGDEAPADDPTVVQGEINGGDVTLDFHCETAYRVGGTVAGLDDGEKVAIDVRYNGLQVNNPNYINGPRVDVSPVLNVDGQFVINYPFLPGDVVTLTLNEAQTTAEKCYIKYGSQERDEIQLVIGEADILDLDVLCGDVHVGGQVESMLGSGLQLDLAVEIENNGNVQFLTVDELIIDENGEFEFEHTILTNAHYQVTINTYPRDPEQDCIIENGEGIADSGDINNIRVLCPGPHRTYEFADNQSLLVAGKEGDNPGDQEFSREIDFLTEFDPELLGVAAGLDDSELFTSIIGQPGVQGALYSNADGRSFWTLTESRTGILDSSVYGKTPYQYFTNLKTIWKLRKNTGDAKFTLKISKAEMVAYDAGHRQILTTPIRTTLSTSVFTKISVYDELYAYVYEPKVGFVDVGVPAYTIGGRMVLRGEASEDPSDNLPIWTQVPYIESGIDHEIWDETKFDFNPAAGVNTDPEYVATLKLAEPIPVELDLSQIPNGAIFHVVVDAETFTHNLFTEEGGAAAFYRDPVDVVYGPNGEIEGSGIEVVEMEGLTVLPLENPDPSEVPVSGTAPAPACESDDFEKSVLEFGADNYELTEGPEGENLDEVQVLRSVNVAGLVSAQISLSEGTATAGEDFNSDDITVRFGDLSAAPRSIDGFIIDDEIDEGPETLTLTLHSPSGCAEIGARSTATVTILANDPSQGSAVFSSDSYTVDESAGVAQITVERVGGDFGTLAIEVDTADGSAVAGVDYSSVHVLPLPFQDGDSEPRIVEIPIIDNVVVDGDRTINLILTSSNGSPIGVPNTATLTIEDNDTDTASSEVQFSLAESNAIESNGSVAVEITRTGNPIGEVSVMVTSIDGTATSPADYTSVNQQVVFADGDSTAKIVTVDIANDTAEEDTENFNLELSALTGDAEMGPLALHTVTIVDDDGAPVALPSAPNLSLASQPKALLFEWDDNADAVYFRLLLDADGSGNFSQVDQDIAQGSTSYAFELAVHSFDWSNGQFMLQACNASGCSDSNIISAQSAMLAAIGYFKSSNSESGDSFGGELALSADGKTLAVGANSERSNAVLVNGNQGDNSISFAGAVYVFVATDQGWVQEAYLKSPVASGVYFGDALAISADGNTLAVGGPFGEAAYVYVRSGDVWSYQAQLQASNSGNGDEFGSVLALSDDGNSLVVGARREASADVGINGDQNDDSAQAAGAAYVFNRTGNSWAQTAYIKSSNTDAADFFGSAVTISGDGATVAVAAEYEDSSATGVDGDQNDNAFDFAGAVYVFTLNGGSWSQQSYIKASNTDEDDRFGASLALSDDGDLLVVGASDESSSATGVDSANEADNSEERSGAVYSFRRDGVVWQQESYFKASNTRTGNYFGRSLQITGDGNTLLIGAFSEKSTSVGIDGDQSQTGIAQVGAAYLFQWDANAQSWSQRHYVKPSTTDPLGNGTPNWLYFGSTLGISDNGETIAIGAPWESSDAQGIGGDQNNVNANASGAVYVY